MLNVAPAALQYRGNGSRDPFEDTISFDFQSDEAVVEQVLPEVARILRLAIARLQKLTRVTAEAFLNGD